MLVKILSIKEIYKDIAIYIDIGSSYSWEKCFMRLKDKKYILNLKEKGGFFRNIFMEKIGKYLKKSYHI